MSWTIENAPDLAGKTAVVTGANSGIGLETARALAHGGARVILGCRSAEKGAEALADIRRSDPGAAVEVKALDLADLSSVRRFAEEVGRELPVLDRLVNNAGIMMPPQGATADGFEAQFGTNHLGHFALTGLLLERLRAAPGARVVTVSSIAHRRSGIDFDNLNAQKSYSRTGAYGQSKLANLLFTYELQRKLEGAGVDAISVAAHPGWTATNLQVHSGLFRFLNPVFSQAPPEGALPTLYAATASDVKGGEYYGPGGLMEMQGAPKRVSSNARSHDPKTAERLWSVSEELTGVRFGL